MLATPLAVRGTQASGVIAPSAGAEVVLSTTRNPAVAVRLVAYTPKRVPAPALRTRLASPDVDTTGVTPAIVASIPTLPMIADPALRPTTPVPSVGSSTRIAPEAVPCPVATLDPATCVRLLVHGP